MIVLLNIFQSKKVISNAAWTKTVKIRCTLLDRNQLGCKIVNIIPFKLEFVKEGFLYESIFNLCSNKLNPYP